MASINVKPWGIQVAGNFRRSAAINQWLRVRSRFPALLNGHDPVVSRVRTPIGRRGTMRSGSASTIALTPMSSARNCKASAAPAWWCATGRRRRGRHDGQNRPAQWRRQCRQELDRQGVADDDRRALSACPDDAFLEMLPEALQDHVEGFSFEDGAARRQAVRSSIRARAGRQREPCAACATPSPPWPDKATISLSMM